MTYQTSCQRSSHINDNSYSHLKEKCRGTDEKGQETNFGPHVFKYFLQGSDNFLSLLRCSISLVSTTTIPPCRSSLLTASLTIRTTQRLHKKTAEVGTVPRMDKYTLQHLTEQYNATDTHDVLATMTRYGC